MPKRQSSCPERDIRAQGQTFAKRTPAFKPESRCLIAFKTRF